MKECRDELQHHQLTVAMAARVKPTAGRNSLRPPQGEPVEATPPNRERQLLSRPSRGRAQLKRAAKEKRLSAPIVPAYSRGHSRRKERSPATRIA